MVVRSHEPAGVGLERFPAFAGQRLLRLSDPACDAGRLPEADYRLFRAQGVSGGLVENAYHAGLRLRLAIRLRPAIERLFLDFLRDNPFRAFAEFAKRRQEGEDVLYVGDALLDSPAFRDARHELVTFAWRSPPEVTAQVRAEVFDEDGVAKVHGGLAHGPIAARRVFVYRDPRTGEAYDEPF